MSSFSCCNPSLLVANSKLHIRGVLAYECSTIADAAAALPPTGEEAAPAEEEGAYVSQLATSTIVEQDISESALEQVRASLVSLFQGILGPPPPPHVGR